MSSLAESKVATTVYRYKFSYQFQSKLVEFTKIHKFDDVNIFREYWDAWLIANNNDVLEEARRLQNLGYKGDVKNKMYKSVRYYHKDKSDKKVEPKKRRVYIALDRDILDTIDTHIDQNKMTRPANAYLLFLANESYKNLIDKTVLNIMHSGLDKTSAELKLKKTYKNRFFLKK